jgi:hypothetical protein
LQLLAELTDASDDRHVFTAAADTIPDLVRLLASKDSTVQKATTRILWGLSTWSEAYCAAIIATGGLPGLENVLQSNSADPTTQEAAARTLWSLASSEPGFDESCTFIASSSPAHEGLLSTLVRLLDSSTPAPVQLAAAGVLINVSAHEHSSAALASNSGAVPAMMQLLQSSTDHMLLELVLGTLYNMVTNCSTDHSPYIDVQALTSSPPSSSASALLKDAAGLMVSFLASSSTGVQAGAAKLLWALCHHYQQQGFSGTYHALIHSIAADHGIPALIHLLKGDDEAAQEAAVSVLAHLTAAATGAHELAAPAAAGVCSADLDSPCCEEYLSGDHGTHTCFNAELDNSSSSSKDSGYCSSSIMEQMVSAGGIPALQQLLHNPAQNEKLRVLAALELGRLSAVAEYRRLIRGGGGVAIGDLLELMRCSEEDQEAEQATWAYMQLVGPRDEK